MKKNAAICLLALLCGLPLSVAAQSNVRVYGLVDLFAGGGGASAAPKITAINSGGLTTSYWGVAGSEDLGDGRSAQFGLEGFFRADTGDAGRVPGEATFARAAFVGLSDDWGAARAGRLSNPLFLAMANMNPFGVSTRLSPLIDHVWSVPFGAASLGDTGWNNAIGYQSPTINGMSVAAQYGLGETGPNSFGNNRAAVFKYANGALALTAAAQEIKNGLNVTSAAPAQALYFGGASYDAGIIKLYATYDRAHADVSGRTTRTGQLGLSVPQGAGSWLLAWARSHEDSNVARSFARDTASAGYDYDLSKRTDLYAVFMYDKLSTASSGNTWALGCRHRF